MAGLVLRGQEWPLVFNSSGGRGFFGEGYWFHKPWADLGLNYEGAGFVAKTTTLNARAGNMPLRRDLSPKELVPKCIVVKPFKGVVLNSVGLSGPGAATLIGQWLQLSHKIRRFRDPWMISFMSVAPNEIERLEEALKFFELLPPLIQAYDPHQIGLQINFSCPNVGLDTSKIVNEIISTLDASEKLGIATLIKLNILIPRQLVYNVASHPGCDGVIVSNTIPWGKLPETIDWRGLFGSETSPLAHIGGGGLSGAPLLEPVRLWIRALRNTGFSKPIIGGGGILSKADADAMFDAGASAIELGSVSILRPWRVRGIIRHVQKRFASKSPPI